MVDIVEQMRITRVSYYDNWCRYAEAIRQHMDQWLDRVDRQLAAELGAVGVFGVDSENVPLTELGKG